MAGREIEYLRVKVKPSSKRPGISELEDGILKVRVKAPPMEGKANAEVIKALAKHLGVKRSQLKIKTGSGSPLKRIVISE
ncbi:DUF167 domain-containing protein [Verrucomicrobiales bacterium]|nr:DUF167 domain-containing protein [Verrucomicrobiales bacterium]|tara:strand:- start:277 stop:516 length:240 start_codon:yes stop_codon:yes gene_type:complete